MASQKEPEQPPAQSVASYGIRQLDRVVSPETRENAYDATLDFASDRPILFLFVASQLFFSLLPLVLFVSFAACVALFALATAVVFTLFWVGVAVLFLVPTLFLTGSIALLVWLWVVAAFVAARWLWNLWPEPEDIAPPPPPRDHQQDARRTSPRSHMVQHTGAQAAGHTQHQEPLAQPRGKDVLE